VDLSNSLTDARQLAARAAGDAASAASRAGVLSTQLDERTAELEAALLRLEDLSTQASSDCLWWVTDVCG